jgi:DNA-binding GntR family transcriptional regulator
MARWREVADDLRARVVRGEFPIGGQLPSIQQLQQQYEVAGQNTIRQAQTLLVNEGLLEAQQGVGVFVIATTPRAAGVEQLLVEMRTARAAVDRAIALLERTATP